METTMRIPEKTKNFLARKGTLDFFIEAASLGKNEVAKWTLLESSKKEINKYLKRKSTAGINKLKINDSQGSLKSNESEDDNPNLRKIRLLSTKKF